AIERTVDDSKELVEKQMTELRGILIKLESEIGKGLEKGNALSAELAKLSQKDHEHGPDCKH
ncbi:hypothetical protein HOM13_01925, partial [Candidatus Woesearchaeota archaeon]|nr:hypothetical protein [Candidatus Woesearchaeota archaeon]